jgi:hypothetical protein
MHGCGAVDCGSDPWKHVAWVGADRAVLMGLRIAIRDSDGQRAIVFFEHVFMTSECAASLRPFGSQTG